MANMSGSATGQVPSEEHPFKEGDVVRMKGQVIPLTVRKTGDNSMVVECQWFNREGNVCVSLFRVPMLEKYRAQN